MNIPDSRPETRNPQSRKTFLGEALGIAPLILCTAAALLMTRNLRDAQLFCVGFAYLLAVTALFSALLPRMAFSLRLLCNAFFAALAYIPLSLVLAGFTEKDSFPALALLVPFLAVYLSVYTGGAASVIPEMRLKQRCGRLLKLTFCLIIVCSVLILLTAAFRELLGAGTLADRPVFQAAPFPFLQNPSGGLLCAAFPVIAASHIFREEENNHAPEP